MAAPKKPDDRQFQVGDHVTVSLSAGRIVAGVVKAIRLDSAGLSADGINYRSTVVGLDLTALIDRWQVVEE